VGRSPEAWTVTDVTRIVSTLQAIHEGMVTADDVWPKSAPTPPDVTGGDKAPPPPINGASKASAEKAESKGPSASSSDAKPSGRSNTPYGSGKVDPRRDPPPPTAQDVQALIRRDAANASTVAEVNAIFDVYADEIEKLPEPVREAIQSELAEIRDKLAEAEAGPQQEADEFPGNPEEFAQEAMDTIAGCTDEDSLEGYVSGIADTVEMLPPELRSRVEDAIETKRAAFAL